MSIRLLEHIRDELRGSGAVQNTPDFALAGWEEVRATLEHCVSMD